MVDKEKDSNSKDKKDNDDDDDDDDFSRSITSDSKSKVPEVNLFGMKIKLDALTLAAGAIATLAAAGTGYLLYNQYNQNKTVEDAAARQRQAQYLNDEKMRQQALFNNYVNDPNKTIPNNPIPNTAPLKRKRIDVPTFDDNALVDMDSYYQPEEPQPINYDKVLSQRSYQQQQQQQSPLNTRPANTSTVDSSDLIDMDQYADNPNMQIDNAAVDALTKKDKQQQPTEDITEEQLLASLNSNNNNYQY